MPLKSYQGHTMASFWRNQSLFMHQPDLPNLAYSLYTCIIHYALSTVCSCTVQILFNAPLEFAWICLQKCMHILVCARGSCAVIWLTAFGLEQNAYSACCTSTNLRKPFSCPIVRGSGAPILLCLHSVCVYIWVSVCACLSVFTQTGWTQSPLSLYPSQGGTLISIFSHTCTKM